MGTGGGQPGGVRPQRLSETIQLRLFAPPLPVLSLTHVSNNFFYPSLTLYLMNRFSGLVMDLNSRLFPLGSLKKHVHCSPARFVRGLLGRNGSGRCRFDPRTRHAFESQGGWDDEPDAVLLQPCRERLELIKGQRKAKVRHRDLSVGDRCWRHRTTPCTVSTRAAVSHSPLPTPPR